MSNQAEIVLPNDPEYAEESPHRKMSLDGLVDAVGESGLETKTTARRCTARVVNRWGKEITGVTLRHRRANDADKEDRGYWGRIASNGDSSSIVINYETGWFADGDYWRVFFTAGGKRWTCKWNFYCDLTKKDEGTLVDIVLNGHQEEMRVVPLSSSCYVTLYTY